MLLLYILTPYCIYICIDSDTDTNLSHTDNKKTSADQCCFHFHIKVYWKLYPTVICIGKNIIDKSRPVFTNLSNGRFFILGLDLLTM